MKIKYPSMIFPIFFIFMNLAFCLFWENVQAGDQIEQEEPNKEALNDLRNAATAQEAYYIDNSKYADSIKTLSGSYGLSISQGVTIQIVSAGKNYYNMVAFHENGNKRYQLTGPGGTIEGNLIINNSRKQNTTKNKNDFTAIGSSASQGSLVGTYSIREQGQLNQFIRIEKQGEKYFLYEKQVGKWLTPVEVKRVSKADLQKMINDEVKVDFMGLGNNIIALFQVPKGWKSGNFICNSGYWLASMLGPIELQKN